VENHLNMEHLVVVLVDAAVEVDFEEGVEVEDEDVVAVAVGVEVEAEDEAGEEVEAEIDMVEAEIVVMVAGTENVIMAEVEIDMVADLGEEKDEMGDMVDVVDEEGEEMVVMEEGTTDTVEDVMEVMTPVMVEEVEVMAVEEVDMINNQQEGDMIKEGVMVVMGHNILREAMIKVADRMSVVMAHHKQTMVNNKIINKCLKLMQHRVIKLQLKWVKGMLNLLLKILDNRRKEVMTKDVVDMPQQEDMNNNQREEDMSNNQREQEKDRMYMRDKEVMIKDSSMHNQQQVVMANKQASPNIRL